MADDSVFDEAFTEGLAYSNEEAVLIDIDKATPAQLRETMLNAYEPNKIRQQTSFMAIVLAPLPNREVGGTELLRVKARIPEIHSLIPLPFEHASTNQGAEDWNRIAMHPTFIGQKKQLLDGSGKSLKAGTHMH